MKALIIVAALLVTGCTWTEATYVTNGTEITLKRKQVWGEDIDFSVDTERAQAELKKSSNTLTPEQREAIMGFLLN